MSAWLTNAQISARWQGVTSQRVHQMTALCGLLSSTLHRRAAIVGGWEYSPAAAGLIDRELKSRGYKRAVPSKILTGSLCKGRVLGSCVMPTEIQIKLDDLRGHLRIYGQRAVVLADECGGLPLGLARESLRVAVLDGRCKIPDDVATWKDQRRASDSEHGAALGGQRFKAG